MKGVRIFRLLAPKSIGARLALGSAVLVIAALLAAGISTGVVLSRFIRGQVDQRLDTQINAVATALSTQGMPTSLAMTDPPPFDRSLDGWYWTASIGDRVYRSASLDDGNIEVRQSDDWWGHRGPGRTDGRPNPFNGVGPRGEPLYLRVQSVPVGGEWATITASAPAHALVRPLRDALVPVVVSMLVLGLLLAGASYAQLRLGLRPLSRMRSELQKVRSGQADRIAEDQPKELQPLALELNSLIAQNAEGIARARAHVSNLGHALNTPLAALSLSLGASDAEADIDRLRLVEEMRDRIRHHLGRARAAALHGPGYLNTTVAPRLDDLLTVLDKVYAERNIGVSLSIDNALAAACEPQDVDEMLGNLLENAFKWASARISVQGRAEGPSVVIGVEDDGPGIDTDRIDEALLSGIRLDETIAGHGFGLPITRELAQLYSGDISLSRSSMGGLRVLLTLPTAR